MRRRLTVSTISVIAILLFGYIYIQSERFLSGPQLSITSPRNGASFSSPVITLAGEAKNISRITLNDRPIFVDERGFFEEEVLLHPGYNVTKIRVEDKFKRVREKKLELVLEGEKSFDPNSVDTANDLPQYEDRNEDETGTSTPTGSDTEATSTPE